MRTRKVVLIDLRYIRDQIESRVASGVNETLYAAQEVALKNVPVRKVFRTRVNQIGNEVGARQDVRSLTMREARSEKARRQRLGLGPAAYHLPSTSGRRQGVSVVRTTQFGSYQSRNRANRGGPNETRDVSRIGGQNRLVQLEVVTDVERKVKFTRPIIDTEAESQLSAAGRAELRRAHLTSKGSSEPTLGGSLKRSIKAIRALPGRSILEAEVIAGSKEVDYAKYVEFGTRHSKAQPFLRPALAEAKGRLLKDVRDSLVSGKTTRDT